MQIAIVGGGFAGMALAYFMREEDVTVFDTGDGASQIAAGLLHDSPGKNRLKSERADEAMREAEALLEIAGWPCQKGLIRDGEKVHGYTVFGRRYLDALKELSGAKIEHEKVSIPDGFDAVVLACGYGIKEYAFDLPLRYIKGQVLRCRGENLPQMSEIGSGYVSLSDTPGECFLGSTYEHSFEDAKPDLEEAKRVILPRVRTFYPECDTLEIIESLSAVRVANKHHYRPIVKQLDNKTFVMTGFGSRGLLYHALYAKELKDALYLPGQRGINGCADCWM
ncbi:MAG: tRNA 5-methylaminomethyl-2-thiouridine biosynthesis bifunctional protein MnmC [Chlamydiia bacterium]|nr:tRNA 5-methylaminomethyl-2-thiouridine biosynthesis bifunctional protein MnmC [Chlamydiia bacterium]MCH9615992.1 tRNA 5-methylaminomethyl-2-thiouridine biosynthesis bifunctional protein MnmC [Chlamydiia bacterium]MCH9629015.1 tRNA 5-methylaminomethyl-2-thiouridine biosynthesis bifunctional protein MnmC [Chlamydiia bacterium]